jgi:hypothetical protein
MNEPIPGVNRSLLIVRLKQPFVDWLNQLPDRLDSEKAHPYTTEVVNMEPSTYLISEIGGEDELNDFFEENGSRILDAIFMEWTENQTYWPKERPLEMLAEWCDLSFHSMVFDLSSDEDLLHI